MEDDPRLTGVGRFLARTKLDELPQLWNVFKGDMSIVGPRPESLDFQDCFDGPYRLVLQHKPGIFGPSQVLFRNERALYSGRPDPEHFYRDVLFPLKAHIDLAYFAHRTFFRDVAWTVWGALAVFGWPSLLDAGALLVKEAEHCVGEGRAGGYSLSARIGLLTGAGRSGVEIATRTGARSPVPDPAIAFPHSQAAAGPPPIGLEHPRLEHPRAKRLRAPTSGGNGINRSSV